MTFSMSTSISRFIFITGSELNTFYPKLERNAVFEILIKLKDRSEVSDVNPKVRAKRINF